MTLCTHKYQRIPKKSSLLKYKSEIMCNLWTSILSNLIWFQYLKFTNKFADTSTQSLYILAPFVNGGKMCSSFRGSISARKYPKIADIRHTWHHSIKIMIYLPFISYLSPPLPLCVCSANHNYSSRIEHFVNTASIILFITFIHFWYSYCFLIFCSFQFCVFTIVGI